VQHAVIERIAGSLAPGGYLFLGHAETLRGLSHAFHLVHTHDTFYYQRKDHAEHPTTTHHFAPAHFAPVPATGPVPPLDPQWYEAIGQAARRIEVLADASARPEPEPVPVPLPTLEAVLELLQRERFADALAMIRALPGELATDPDVLLVEALLLVQDGKIAAAADLCRVLLQSDEMSAGANFVLGLCFEAMGAGEAAMQHYSAAGHLDPQFAMPRLRLGLLARRAGNLEAARRDLLDALELLRSEDTSRLLLFGGGFTRSALSRLCETELRACEAAA
jgi:chemotaxis protein methyltransferase CheR